MAVTEQSYTGNGSTTNYSFTFPYLKSGDIEVQVDATVQATNTWSLANATTVQFNSAPANGAKIKILRQTNVDNLTATFYAGSAIKSEDLNDNFTQNLYKTQEVGNRFFQTTGGTMSGDLTLGEDAVLVFEGATDNAHETTLTVTDPTADRTVTIPNVSGTVVTTGDTGTVTATMLAANSVDSSELVDGSVDLSHMSANSVDSDQYVDGSIDTIHIADSQVTAAKLASDAVTTAKIASDAITGAKIADDAINSEHYTDGSIDTAHIADSQITSAKIADSQVTTAKVADDAITQAKIADDAVGADQLASNAVVSASIADGSVVNADINASAAIAHNKLAAVPDGQVIVGNGSTVPTAVAISGDITLANDGAVTIANDAVEIGMIGCEQTTISDSDSHIPTSGAVVDYVAAQLAVTGGLTLIADEDNFPTSQPASGLVISIKSVDGIVINGSGVSTTARTAGNGSDNVTINGFPSDLYSKTLSGSLGLMVSSTGSGHIYTYHKLLAKESDVEQLSQDINDFGNRYRVHAGEPSSNNDDGDLVWDTNADKMKVYDATASAWTEVTSTGQFKYLFLCPAGGTGAPTLDGSIATYDLREASNSGSAASVTSAAQLLVSVNGVVQKANTGTSAPAEGFALADANTIVFGSNLASGDSVFIVQSGSAVSIPTPGDNTVTSAKIVDGTIVNADINASAAIAGSKLADDSITEAKLDIHAAPTGTDKFLKYTSNGMEWVVPSYTTNTNTQLTEEQVEDFVGGMVTGNTETGITVTYEDSDGTLDFVVDDTTKLPLAGGTITGALVLDDSVGATITAATSASTITLDLGASVHHSVTLAHNTTFADPSNEVVGQSGSIIITQDGTGSRTAAWNSAWKWAGGEAPTLTTTANAVDRIDYLVIAAGNINAVASLDVK